MAKKSKNIRQLQIFTDYYERLKNIAMSVFKWEGLPDTCNERFLEESLFLYGHAVFVKDDEMSFLNLNVAPSDVLNVYREPLRYTAYSCGYSKIYDRDNCVYIRNNYQAAATNHTITLFAERLANLELTHEVNIKAQKTPMLIRCDDKTKTSLEALYNQYDGDKPVIYGAKTLTDKPIETIVTGAPFVADRLREEKRAIWNEAMEFLGINSNPSDKKKERLITSEVNSNNEQVDIQIATMYVCRKKACEEINNMYGLNIDVSLRLEEIREITQYHDYEDYTALEEEQIYG